MLQMTSITETNLSSVSTSLLTRKIKDILSLQVIGMKYKRTAIENQGTNETKQKHAFL